jgi:hypothetical protein
MDRIAEKGKKSKEPDLGGFGAKDYEEILDILKYLRIVQIFHHL